MLSTLNNKINMSSTIKNVLTEKDLIKFNLVNKKEHKMNSKQIAQNKKDQIRKNLMLNTQIISTPEPKRTNLNVKSKIDNSFNNNFPQTKEQIKQQQQLANQYLMGTTLNKKSKILNKSSVSKDKNKNKNLSSSFMTNESPLKSRDKLGASYQPLSKQLKHLETYTTNTYNKTISNTKNTGKLKSSHVLLKVSMSLDNSFNTNNNTSFNPPNVSFSNTKNINNNLGNASINLHNMSNIFHNNYNNNSFISHNGNISMNFPKTAKHGVNNKSLGLITPDRNINSNQAFINNTVSKTKNVSSTSQHEIIDLNLTQNSSIINNNYALNNYNNAYINNITNSNNNKKLNLITSFVGGSSQNLKNNNSSNNLKSTTNKQGITKQLLKKDKKISNIKNILSTQSKVLGISKQPSVGFDDPSSPKAAATTHNNKSPTKLNILQQMENENKKRGNTVDKRAYTPAHKGNNNLSNNTDYTTTVSFDFNNINSPPSSNVSNNNTNGNNTNRNGVSTNTNINANSNSYRHSANNVNINNMNNSHAYSHSNTMNNFNYNNNSSYHNTNISNMSNISNNEINNTSAYYYTANTSRHKPNITVSNFTTGFTPTVKKRNTFDSPSNLQHHISNESSLMQSKSSCFKDNNNNSNVRNKEYSQSPSINIRKQNSYESVNSNNNSLIDNCLLGKTAKIKLDLSYKKHNSNTKYHNKGISLQVETNQTNYNTLTNSSKIVKSQSLSHSLGTSPNSALKATANQLKLNNNKSKNAKDVIEKVWPYFVDKYLKYLFSGKVLKFREAVINSEKIEENMILGYSHNTNNGIIRTYNEDRITCISSLSKPKTKELPDNVTWPKISYFAIFDGHGGCSVSDWLSQNLHLYIVNQKSFPENPTLAILQGFKEAEEILLSKLLNGTLCIKPTKTQNKNIGNAGKRKHDTSGSCAIISIIIDKECYVANVGDSRALLSFNEMSRLYTLTNDHKPEDPTEKRRIESNGGKIWKQGFNPHRVIPGGLSVSHKLF